VRRAGKSSRRPTKGERRIASILAYIPPAREQLVAAMEPFGDEFDLERLTQAARGDAKARNAVAALERDFEVLVNWIDELATRGLAEATRRGAVEKSAGTGFERLNAAGVVSARSADRLGTLRAVRDELQHAYAPHAKAALLHRGVTALLAELDRFVDRFERWAKELALL
jgi:hypothetical protein